MRRASLAAVQALEGRVLLSASLIKDINTTLADANPTNFVVSNGQLYFSAESGRPGGEQWKTDGTPAGTVHLGSLVPGAPNAPIGYLTDANGTLYFFSQGPADGSGEGLYKSNGTVAGTSEIYHVVEGSDLTNVNGTLYFMSGGDLWKSDGTAAGTVDVVGVVGERSAGPSNFFAAGNLLYFQEGFQLFRSDGTAAGTFALSYSGPPIYSMVSFDGELYFSSMAGLYKTDGTSAGTQLVTQSPGEFGDLFNDNGTLYFTSGNSSGTTLWKSDGTAAGTVEVSAVPNNGIGPFAQVNGTLYFYGNDAAHGTELWRSDGTAAGTELVADINPGPASCTKYQPTSSFSPAMIGFNGKVYLDATDGVHGMELWQSDGTAAGTSQLLQINSTTLGSSITEGLPSSAVTIGNVSYFTANDGIHGDQLWQTDGTAAGTVMAADIPPTPPYSNIIISGLFDFNGALLFDVNNGVANNLYEIARPGAAPTILSPNTDAWDYAFVGGELYFLSFTSSGELLMATDGTAAGTRQIMNVSQDYSQLSMANLNGTLYFTTLGPTDHMALWKTDGTSAGTSQVVAFADAHTESPDLTAIGSKLYFAADDGTHGPALWKTDGTAAGTSMLWASGSASRVPDDLYAFNGDLYFTTQDPAGYFNDGQGLYKSDGTAAGTVLLANYTSVHDFTAALGELYFIGAPAGSSSTFCVTDGTAAGTRPIDPSLFAGYAQVPMVQVNGLLFLAGYSAGSGQELWQTDGTTTQLADPSEISSGWTVDGLLGQSGNTLLFAATDLAHGSELWGLPVALSATSAMFVGADTTTGGNWNGTYGSDGYSIFGGGQSLPAYVTLETANAQYYQWAPAGFADSRAPQIGANSNTREAATDYSGTSFSVDLNFTDAQTHHVAFYLLDYDYQHRSETVQVSNGDNGQVLDTRTISNFSGGQYLVYSLSGHVKITFTNAGSLNAVLSAILFDPSRAGSGTRTTSAYAGVDYTTQGHWTGVYGSEGYDVIGGSENLPGYADLSISNAQFYVWNGSTTDPRALQSSPGSSTGVAACDYSDSSSFSINLNLTDGKLHRVTLYFVDYDRQNRSEMVQISDAVTGVVFSSSNVQMAGFSSGEYFRWDLSGDVKITISNFGGLNEVLSGIFFDPGPVASASFVTTDSTTQGNYSGVYGQNGYDLLALTGGGATYSSLNFPSNIQSYEWNADTTESRVLQYPGSTQRAAACYYSNAPSLSFNLDLTDGNTHRVAFYFLDYDYRNRAETVQISNAVTGAVLDTESLSNFSQGKYLVWNLSGDLNITITKTGGLNEVISGIFFG